ncbi:MAG: hypothetical protein ABI608_09005 [Rhizomicrobium sp.]
MTGTKSREVVEQFVSSFVTPTRMTGKIARWEDGVCPITVGQRPAVAAYVTQRVKDLAAMVGAPVNAAQSCKPNIEIVFTTTPQDLLNNVRAHDADYLGFAESSDMRDRLAIVTRPLQAWYTTQTKDLHGLSRVDSGDRRGEGIAMPNFTAASPCRGCVTDYSITYYLPYATEAHVTGDRISDGVRSAFFHVLIVADPSKLQDRGIGELADYIAMLALTQLNSLDTCQQLPSIVNMLASGCDRKTNTLTDNDTAYLRGLYKMNADRRLLATQKGDIAGRMSQTLGEQ